MSEAEERIERRERCRACGEAQTRAGNTVYFNKPFVGGRIEYQRVLCDDCLAKAMAYIDAGCPALPEGKT